MMKINILLQRFHFRFQFQDAVRSIDREGLERRDSFRFRPRRSFDRRIGMQNLFDRHALSRPHLLRSVGGRRFRRMHQTISGERNEINKNHFQ